MTLRSRSDVLTALSRPVDPRHVRQLKKGGATLDYVPWHIVAKHLSGDIEN